MLNSPTTANSVIAAVHFETKRNRGAISLTLLDTAYDRGLLKNFCKVIDLRTCYTTIGKTIARVIPAVRGLYQRRMVRFSVDIWHHSAGRWSSMAG